VRLTPGGKKEVIDFWRRGLIGQGLYVNGGSGPLAALPSVRHGIPARPIGCETVAAGPQFRASLTFEGFFGFRLPCTPLCLRLDVGGAPREVKRAY
jgi:hypothetical protein